MRNRYLLLMDLPLLVVAAVGAFILRIDFLGVVAILPIVMRYVLLALVIKPPIFVVFGLYSRYWRYVSTNDMLTIAVAVGTAGVTMTAVVLYGVYSGFLQWFPRSILFIDAVLTLLACGGLRLSIRILGERASHQPPRTPQLHRRILIVGAGDAGAAVVREMQRNPGLAMQPVAFVDDNPLKHGKRIFGLPVFGPVSALASAITQFRVDETVIALPEASGGMLRSLADVCRVQGVPSKTVPGVVELLGTGVTVSRIREIDISDLLRRPHTSIGTMEHVAYLAGKVVLVTGAGGSIGSELSRQIAAAGPAHLVLLGHGENSLYQIGQKLEDGSLPTRLTSVLADVRDAERLRHEFDRYRPDIVIHAAAHKHVPLIEQNPTEAILNNVVATRVLTQVALATNVERLVLISTDKAVSPTSVMGASKRVAEAIVQQAANRHRRAWVVVRFGNVLGSRGSVVPLFRSQIEKGGPLTITHPEMKRFFMTIPEAVHLVLMAGGVASGGEVFVLNMGDQVRIVDLANDMIRLSGQLASEIPIVFTGLRPGEKLQEALWEADADVRPTAHPEILQITEQRAIAPQQLDEFLDLLHHAAVVDDRQALDSCLRDIVPSYRPIAGRTTTISMT